MWFGGNGFHYVNGREWLDQSTSSLEALIFYSWIKVVNSNIHSLDLHYAIFFKDLVPNSYKKKIINVVTLWQIFPYLIQLYNLWSPVCLALFLTKVAYIVPFFLNSPSSFLRSYLIWSSNLILSVYAISKIRFDIW